MNARFLLSVVTAAALAGSAGAQQRKATMVGGGNGNSGRCSAEVRVDGAAEVEIRGDMATLRDLSGQQPQWQRFECTGPVPANANLRLTANGRGRVELAGSPQNGGPAVVRIQDPEGGAQVYQFELSWNNGGQGYQSNDQRYPTGAPAYANNQPYQNGPAYNPPLTERRDTDRRDWRDRGGRFTTDQAIQVCRDAVRDQAMRQFGTRDVNFRRINIDDEPGRNDWVVGMMEVRGGRGEEHLRFSCSVNFDTGRVRSAEIQPRNVGSAARDIVAREMDTCRDAVTERLGAGRVEFGRMTVDNQNRDDLVIGTARSRGRSFDFTCSVSPYSGNVRNLDVRRR
jgi:hypothetical protein